MRIMCSLFWEPSRGDAEKTLEQWAKILGVTPGKARKIIHYLFDKKIVKNCKKNEIFDEKNHAYLVNQILSKNKNDIIYIASKRMLHDEYIRNIRREAGAKGGNPELMKRAQKTSETEPDLLNQNQTPSSSSSSSLDITNVISGPGDPDPPKNGHFEFHVGGELNQIIKYCQAIVTLQKDPPTNKNFNPFQFVQLEINKKKHPGAVAQTLKTLIDYWATIESPWRYSSSIMKTLNQNYNEAEHIKQAAEFKEAFEVDPDIKTLLDKII